ncbi:Probable methyltransferase TARBP1 [Geodia barretti]|nr:Probable methyltransferase TARBP1 [Geodia barretti]
MEWGPLVEWCEAQTWTATHYCLRHQSQREAGDVRSDDGCRWEICDIWELCAERVDCVTGRQLPTLLDCLCLALPFVEVSNISSTVTGCWRIVKDCLSSLPSFLSLLLHPHILFSSDSLLVELVGKLCSEVLELGERRAGLTNFLASTLCASWRGEWERGGEERVVQSLLRHRQLILELCCFGGIGIRSMRSQEDGEEFVRLLGDQVAANSAANSCLHGDCRVRLTILSFLVGVASRRGSSHFLSQFSREIMEKLSDLTATKPRYFINSLTHRRKQRLLQTLLLLLPHLPSEGDEDLAGRTLQLLGSDNQPSVRHLLEWTASVLLARQPHLVSSLLLPALLPDSQFRLSRLQSVFTVALHLTQAWDHAHTVRYCKTLLPLVFPWTTCHHFLVRLYAQKTAQVVWEEGREGEEGQLEGFINSCIMFMREHSDAARSSHKLEANVGLSLLRPFSDLSVQALFDYLPRLCGAVDSECVSVEELRHFWEQWGGGEGGVGEKVPLYCDNGALREMVKRGGVGGGEGGKGDDTRSIAHQLGVGEDGVEGEGDRGDIQKKITRWASGAGVMEELFPGRRLPVETSKVAGGLVVVASLLTKIPNLGGLCRTCEIFGAGQLVVSSLSVVDDPQFSALSVSAQHWLNISEVRLPKLPSYLLAMRRAGYQLVGAEQTAQSKSITSYSFQPLTLLLLGNEREGIPVQLLQLLDECVEIPQLGVIRSLNVHVSGALLVWEYCKQHLHTSST